MFLSVLGNKTPRFTSENSYIDKWFTLTLVLDTFLSQYIQQAFSSFLALLINKCVLWTYSKLKYIHWNENCLPNYGVRK